MTNELTRQDLKVLALKERLAQVVVEYEDRDAERRIDITELNQKVQELEQKLDELEKAEDITSFEKE